MLHVTCPEDVPLGVFAFLYRCDLFNDGPAQTVRFEAEAFFRQGAQLP